jgi:hypothetical protein
MHLVVEIIEKKHLHLLEFDQEIHSFLETASKSTKKETKFL